MTETSKQVAGNMIYPSSEIYQLPHKNILVLSCIDLRLTDNLLHFLHFDNLQNKYDHFALAGTSLLCSQDKDSFSCDHHQTYHEAWNTTFEQHVQIACNLHHIQDVYIVEHQDCGAYATFLKPELTDFKNLQEEKNLHLKFAQELADKIHENENYAYSNKKKTLDGTSIEKKYKINVHCFFIDLRGNVELLYTTTRAYEKHPL